MNRVARVCLLFCLGITLNGCAGGKNYRLGREAERRGDAHVAYDHYCKAAINSPDNKSIGAAIKRLAPTAATYWDSQARVSFAEGRHAEAWDYAVRCLQIRPDHKSALALVQRIRSEHPRVASAASSGRNRLPAGSPPRNVVPSKPPERRVATGPKVVSKPSQSPPPKVRPRTGPRRSTSSNKPAVAKKPPSPRPKPPQKRKSAPKKPDKRRPKKSQKRPASQAREYVRTCTLSEDDDRFKDRADAIDGVSIELKDTDAEKDVDLDLYDGARRIQKIRNLRLGRSKMFRGRSGKWYRLTILRVHDDSGTVRIGIKPA